MKRKESIGIAIALAWPQTYCKEPGAWYDPVTRWLGINRNNYYRAGHAALVLIDRDGEQCHYFDFGRYHAPFQHGRVRSAVSDHDLAMNTIPQIDKRGKTIQNFEEILHELQQNPACHGEGELYASYCKVDFMTAYDKAVEMQQASPIPYGPFMRNGSNCSRFVNTAIMAGNPTWKYKFRLKLLVPLTPTPMNNVNALQHKIVLPKLRRSVLLHPTRKLSKFELESTLPQPERHPHIPESAQWLSGEGAGSWFELEFHSKLLKVTRYSPEGIVECSGLYEGSNAHGLSPKDFFTVDYPSNCNSVVLKNGSGKLIFERILYQDHAQRIAV